MSQGQESDWRGRLQHLSMNMECHGDGRICELARSLKEQVRNLQEQLRISTAEKASMRKQIEDLTTANKALAETTTKLTNMLEERTRADRAPQQEKPVAVVNARTPSIARGEAQAAAPNQASGPPQRRPEIRGDHRRAGTAEGNPTRPHPPSPVAGPSGLQQQMRRARFPGTYNEATDSDPPSDVTSDSQVEGSAGLPLVRGLGEGRMTGWQCILCGAFYKSRNMRRHFRIKHGNYLGGLLHRHPEYPRKFFYKTPMAQRSCPVEFRPSRSELQGVHGVIYDFVVRTPQRQLLSGSSVTSLTE